MSGLPKNPLPTMTIIDFETNGAKTADGKLDVRAQLPVEVCAVRMVEGEVTSVFNTLVYYNQAEKGWSEALENGHHDSADLLKGMPEHMVAEILWYMVTGEDTVLCAFNATFDFTVLLELFRRHFGDDAVAEMMYKRIICPLTIARDRIATGGHKLQAVCAHYGVELDEAHTAHDDTMALVDLVNVMHEQEDITGYVNVLGYKRQYGEPEPGTYPNGVTLKPQGVESFFHHGDGSVTRQAGVNGKPHQKMVMGKPVAPAYNPGAGATRPSPPANRPAPPPPAGN